MILMKRLISMLTALSLAASVTTAAFAENTAENETSGDGAVLTAADIYSEWAKDEIEKALRLKIAEPGTVYQYTEPISRELFCEMVYNLVLCVNESMTVEDNEVKFTDTDNRKVYILNKAGIVQGKSDTEFAPDDSLTREEAATILVRMINREMPMTVSEVMFNFEDSPEISDWASESVQAMCNLGFMLGVGENKFAPKDTYTAEQAMATLVRIYEANVRSYTYETPLGTVESDSDCSSHINFAVLSDAKIELIKDNYKTQCIMPGEVKALTNQTSSMLISFEDFAEIFGGEWKLENGIFKFNYDAAVQPETAPWEKTEATGDWENKTDSVDVIVFSDTIEINGETTAIKAQYGGKVTDGCIVLCDGTLYIPVQMVAQLMGYELGALRLAK